MDELFLRLKTVRQLRIACGPWKGEGAVIVEQTDNSLLFREQGHWQDGTKFSNVYRWTKKQDTITLEHLRLNQPQLLFVFPSEPVHRCGPDCYKADLSLSDQGVKLLWQVTGPKKNHTAECEYY